MNVNEEAGNLGAGVGEWGVVALQREVGPIPEHLTMCQA